MDPYITIREIKKLLNSLEGVNVVKSEINKYRVSIYFSIESHRSHLWLNYCAEASNIRLDCWNVDRPWSEKAINNPALALIYRYEVTKERGGIWYRDFECLGIFLVWLIHSSGKIQTKEANRLLDLWNGAKVKEGKKQRHYHFKTK